RDVVAGGATDSETAMHDADPTRSPRLSRRAFVASAPPLLAAGSLLATGLSGCGSGGGNPGESSPADTIIYARGGDSRKLDPIHEISGESVKVLVNIYDNLVGYDDDATSLTPSLAESWTTSADGTEWTFKLRPGVKFHDGNPLTASDVVFTFERLTQANHPDVFDPVRPYSEAFKNITKIEAVDPLTVKFTLTGPSAVFLANLAMFPAQIVSQAAVKKWGKAFGDHPVGAGPFRFVRRTTDVELVLEANPDHWRGKPKVAQIVFIPVAEPAKRVEQLRRGETTMADDLPPNDLKQLEKDPALTVQRRPGMNVCYLAGQMEKAPFDNLVVREAIWQAIDKARLIEICYGGGADPAVHLLPPTLTPYYLAMSDRAYDPEKAKQALAEEQAAGRFQPRKLSLFMPTSPRPYLPEPQKTAVFIRDQLGKIGLDVEIVPNRIDDHFARLSRGEHDLGLIGWSSDNADPDNFLYQLLDPDQIRDDGNNASRYNNPEFHKLMLAGQVELDQAKRVEIYHAALKIAFADAPVVPLVHMPFQCTHQKRLTGYKLHPTGMVRLRAAEFTPETT
ncbi:MAG TPA: ABC transporter substrate-binding protein, partial [Pirellulales bacterium]